MFGKKRTNLNVQTIESMAKIYRHTLSTHDQKSFDNRIELGPWVLIENSSLLIITKKYDSKDDEDWNPDEMNETSKINNNDD